MYSSVVRRALIALSKSAALFGLGFLALFVHMASAQTVVSQGPLNYFQNYFVTGDYVVAGVGGLSTQGGNPTASINFSGVPCTTGPGVTASVVPCAAKGAVPADIIAAFLYWQTTETSKTPTATTGTFDANLSNPNASPYNPNLTNEPMVGTLLGSPQIPACVAGGGESKSSYVRVYRADVLPYLSINANANVRTANYTHTIAFTGNPTTGTVFNGATLVVVYRLVTPGNPRVASLRSVVIYDGAFTGVASRSPSLNQTMGGFYEASTSPSAKMTQIVGGGQRGYQETLTVNGAIPQGVSNPFVGAQGADWDNYTFNYNLASGAPSVVTEVQSSNDCLSWAAIITSTNVQDSDFDGLLDIWETSGLYFNPGVRTDGTTTTPTPASFGTCTQNEATCVNFPNMGAKSKVPDIFIQIDWMASTGLSVPNHVHIPQYAALSMVGAVFQSHGVNMHFDVGNNYQGQPYIVSTPYAQGGNVVQESSVLCLPGPTTTCNFPSQSDEYSVLGWKGGFGSIKDGDPSFPSPPGPVGGLPALFAVNRKDSFHYALFGHAIGATTPLSTPEAGSISGVGDLPGGDFMVTLGLWRSDNPAADQVGTVLEQAGTLMHELGHNLDLHHGGWNNTPICMPDYPSVMNYLYQVAGLTDASGNEHIDYSYGLQLPMAEDFLSALIPMGIQNYKVRYFGPFNSATDTPGQASQVFCSGDLLNTGSITNEGKYVLLQGASVSTPDWSNGTILPLGKLITSGLDINYDGIGGQIFTDSPDWVSLNLQQVSARANSFAASADLGKSDGGTSDLGKSDGGTSDLGKSDGGTSQLGADALGDANYTASVLSGSLGPPTGLTVAVTTGGTGNQLNWTGNAGVASQYNVYRCNGSAGPCTPAAPALTGPGGVNSGTPVVTTYTDSVNDYVHAGSTCPATSTCYNTTYYYYVTEVNTAGIYFIESRASNTVSSDVTHLFVVANNQTATYGAAYPATPTYTVYSNVGPATSLAGVTCVYPSSRPVNAGNYAITCAGPAIVSNTEGVTYNLSNNPNSPPSLSYPTTPTNLGGTVTLGSLTISKANTSTKITSVSPSPATTAGQVTIAVKVGAVAPGAGTPTQTVTVSSSPAGSTCVVTLSAGAGSCVLAFAAPGNESITATYGGDPNFNGSASTPATSLPVSGATLNSITVAPAPHTSFTGDTVWANYDYPGQGTVLANGGSGPVTSGAPFSTSANGINITVNSATLVVTFPGAFNFNNTPVAFDGLAITDPLANITGVSLGSNTTGGTPQVSFDGNDVYINFPHPAFSSIPSGATLTVNVTFAASTPVAPYSLPGGSSEQFTAIGNYSSGPSQNLTGVVTWGASSTPSGVATINSAGVTTGVSDGSSTITATLGGVTGTVTITVPSLLSIAVTPPSPSITGTNTQQFTAIGTYSDSSTQPLTGLVTWASSATSVATINAAGLATGVSQGSTTISAALGGVTGTMLLTVNPALPSNLTFTSSPNLPNGQFMSPYTPVTMTATGGSGSYTWALQSALPLGMTLNPTTGVISGTPSQAGQWQSGLTATDNMYPSLTTGFQRINITVGLATAYAGGGNCYMPYPATPMFNPGDSTYNNWSVTASGALAGQFSILPASATGGSSSSGANDVLVGCPVGVPSGTYQLTFNISPSGDTLTLPIQVVGQDTQDNGSYNINSEGVGGLLPPQSVQQGVLNVNQANIGPLTLSYGADSEGFTGNFLFGFNGIGVDPNGCGTAAAFNNSGGVTLSAAPPNPGRYDLLFDGTPSSCPTAFPASPAPIVFASADVLNSSVPWNGSIVSGVQISTTASAPGPQTQQGVLNALDILQQAGSTPPSTIPVTLNFTGAGASTNAILVGLSTDYLPQACVGSPSGTVSTSVNVPNVPGRYYIAIDTLPGNACSLGSWPSGSPGVSQFIGIVDVWASSSGLPGNSANFTPSASGAITITPTGTTTQTLSEATNTITFAFCVGPNADNCNSSGMYGTATISANQVTFQFYGSTNSAAGSFVIYISGLTSTIDSVTPNTGSLGTGTFGLTSFTSNSMTFTGTTSSGFNAVGGLAFTFNVN
jgi:Bacterial Ig-like domain (group 2)